MFKHSGEMLCLVIGIINLSSNSISPEIASFLKQVCQPYDDGDWMRMPPNYFF